MRNYKVREIADGFFVNFPAGDDGVVPGRGSEKNSLGEAKDKLLIDLYAALARIKLLIEGFK